MRADGPKALQAERASAQAEHAGRWRSRGLGAPVARSAHNPATPRCVNEVRYIRHGAWGCRRSCEWVDQRLSLEGVYAREFRGRRSPGEAVMSARGMRGGDEMTRSYWLTGEGVEL